jgi:hypothetical protein
MVPVIIFPFHRMIYSSSEKKEEILRGFGILEGDIYL